MNPPTNLPSNTRRDKEERRTKKVVKGKVKRRKKTLGEQLKGLFIGDDADSIGSYILHDVLVPAVKDTVTNAIQGGIEMLFYGERSGRPMSRQSSYGARVNTPYTNYSKGHREAPRASRRTKQFEDVLLTSQRDAQDVLNSMVDIVEQYGHATMADLQDLVGMSGDYTANNYGWYNLSTARIRRVREGYLLDLPKPLYLD